MPSVARFHTGIFFFYSTVLGFLVGVIIRSFWEVSFFVIAWIVSLAFVLAVFARCRQRETSAAQVWFVVVAILGIALGVLRLDIASWNEEVPHYESHLGQQVQLSGVVIREPDLRERVTQLYVQTEQALILVSADRFIDVSYGDVVVVTGELTKPESFTTDLGRTFNYPGYLKARGVSYQLRFSEVEVTGSGAGNPIIAWLLTNKLRFMYSLESVVPEPAAGLGEGLLLGVKRALGEDLEVAFRRTGIIHIVVLSGYNVMLVVTFTLYLLAFFLKPRFRMVFGVLAIAAFALLVGLSATVVRASIMAALLLVLQNTGHTYHLMRALVLAGLIMLIINPYLLVFDVGFQLSFLATMGLIVLAPVMVEKFTLVPTVIGVREFLVATIATQLFVLPILLYQIGELSIVSVLVNVLVLPMVPIAMLLTFITGIIALYLPWAALPFAYLSYLSLTYIIFIAEFFARLPFAAVVVPAFAFWLVPVLYAAGGFLLYKVLKAKETPDKLAGWIIVEEETLESKKL